METPGATMKFPLSLLVDMREREHIRRKFRHKTQRRDEYLRDYDMDLFFSQKIICLAAGSSYFKFISKIMLLVASSNSGFGPSQR